MQRLVLGATTEMIVKKSKFISMLSFCRNEEDLKEQKSRLSALHPNARHIVHAAVFSSGELFSYSDDKEPKFSAGLPTFEVLKGCGAINVVLFTIRYFGGTLLGVGGLKRAYADSAKLCVDSSRFETVKEIVKLEFEADYSQQDRIMKFLRNNSVANVRFSLNTDVKFSIDIESENYDFIKSGIQNILKREI